MTINMSQAREVGPEATFSVPPGIAAAMWDDAMQAAPTIESWVGCEDKPERLTALLRAAHDVARLVPPDIQGIARDFVAAGNEYGAMIVGGFTPPQPVSELVPRTAEFPADSSAARAAGIMAVAASMMFGPPITYSTNPKGPIGKIIVSAAPIENAATALSSANGLGWHVEVNDSPLRPDVLSLFGIRGDERAKTGILPVQKILAQTDSATIETLFSPRFLHPVGLAQTSERRLSPVLSQVNGRVGMALDWRYDLLTQAADPGDTEALAAIDSIKRVLARPLPLTLHCLRPGQVLAIDNHGLHCRTGFNGAVAPILPRWMLRTFTGSQRHIDNGAPIVDPTVI